MPRITTAQLNERLNNLEDNIANVISDAIGKALSSVGQTVEPDLPPLPEGWQYGEDGRPVRVGKEATHQVRQEAVHPSHGGGNVYTDAPKVDQYFYAGWSKAGTTPFVYYAQTNETGKVWNGYIGADMCRYILRNMPEFRLACEKVIDADNNLGSTRITEKPITGHKGPKRM